MSTPVLFRAWMCRVFGDCNDYKLSFGVYADLHLRPVCLQRIGRSQEIEVESAG